MENNNVTETKNKKKRKPATAKFKVGQVWYVAMKENPRDCMDVTILEILDNKRVLVQYNTKKAPTYTYRAEDLHKTPDKTMPGAKSKARALKQMREKEVQKQKKGIKQTLQNKVAQLSHNGYAFKNDEGKFALKNVPGVSVSVDTVEELEQFVNEKLVELSALKERLATKKYIYITDKMGTALYTIVSISNKKMQISCNWVREEITVDPTLVIDSEEVPMYRLNKVSYGERKRQEAEQKTA